MRAVAQRVSRAEIRIEGRSIACMEQGLLAFVGVQRGDGPEDAARIADKLVGLRVFGDARGNMNQSLLELDASLCVVSQFTLLGDCRKGRRPSYGQAAEAGLAEPLVDAVVEAARERGACVITGRFGARMQVELTNEGPVTLLVDSRQIF
ncbi:MAG: D-tyrosyl-tRNA(Tyr) deacylase [Myxococcales bacterium]|nr:D-tyrosyl-tRNA(Tyr) deacylase [Myxococcales bacterium]